jgi:SPP1 family predicted phage head-tail adaptor
MRVGLMNRRVQIQNLAPREDAYGGDRPAWSTVAERWASIEPLKVAELLAAGQTEAVATHKVRLWFCEELTQRSRLVYRGRVFEVVELRDIRENHRELEALVAELVNPDGKA